MTPTTEQIEAAKKLLYHMAEEAQCCRVWVADFIATRDAEIIAKEAEIWIALAKHWGDTEARSEEAHAVYQEEAHKRGDVRHPDAYAELSEPTKEWDRVLVRWVERKIEEFNTFDAPDALIQHDASVAAKAIEPWKAAVAHFAAHYRGVVDCPEGTEAWDELLDKYDVLLAPAASEEKR